MSEVEIRPVRPDDAEALGQMRARAEIAEYITSLPSERLGETRKYMETWTRNDHVFVAELDGRVVGMAGLHVREGKMRHSAWVGIMVHDAFQRRGIGRALMAKVLELADRWIGLLRVDLTVLEYNTGAIQLYEQLGFVVEGRQRKATYYDGKLHDVILMARLKG
jgi:putative acetyltransferase